MNDAEEKYRALLDQQARLYESMLRSGGPGRNLKREKFRALVVDAKMHTIEDAAAALIDFARPALAFSNLPRELWMWPARVGDWYAVFYDSTPAAGEWMEGEESTGRARRCAVARHLARAQRLRASGVPCRRAGGSK